MKASIHTKQAPTALGPYSQAVEQHGMIFCSGQIGLDPASGTLVEGGIEIETDVLEFLPKQEEGEYAATEVADEIITYGVFSIVDKIGKTIRMLFRVSGN